MATPVLPSRLDARLTRRWSAVLTVIALVLASFSYLLVGGATAAHAATPGINSNFDCSGSTVYALEGSNNGNPAPGSLVALDTTSLGSSQVAGTHITDLPGETDPNALGMTPDGSEAIAVRRSTPAGTSTVPIYKYDAATAMWTTDPNGSADNTGDNFVAGAYDPANGVYYYADYDGSAKQATIYGYDVTHDTPISGTIATADLPLNIAPDSNGINGDLAFDRDGNLYFVESEVTSVGIGIVHGPIPTTGHPFGSQPHLTQTTVSTFSKPETTLYKGVAFDNVGHLDVLFADDSTTYLEVINPTSGAVVSGPTTLGLDEATRSGTDLASCSLNPSLSAAANVSGRVNPTDQFSLSITGGGVSGNNTATTSGSATGVQSQTAGPVLAMAATTYTVTQTAASGSLASYNVSYSCTDAANSGHVVTSGTGSTVSLPFPAADGASGADVTCTFTDDPKSASLDTVKTIYSVNGNTSVDSSTPLNPGDVVVYHDTVTNTGVSTGTTVLSDSVPAHTTYTGTGQGWSCTAPAPAATACTQSVTVAVGSPVTKSYTVTVDQPIATGTATITSQVTSSVGTCSSCSISNPTASALYTYETIWSVNGDTSVTDSTPLKAGDVVTYHVFVGNTGGTDATLTVTDPVPANSSYTGNEGWSCPGGTDAGDVCTATGNIPAGVSTWVGYTITLTNPLPAGTTSITSQITASAGTCSACTVVNPTVAALDTTKTLATDNATPVAPGQQVGSGDVLGYAITVTNTGGSTGSTTVTETVPAHTTYTGTGEGWTCTDVTAGSTCTQTFTAGSGASSTHTFTVTAGTLPAGVTSVDNSVTTSAGTCSACSVTSSTTADLSVAKSIATVNGNPADASTQIAPGDVIGYRFTVRNDGGSTGSATISDPVPANTTYAGTGEGWTCSTGASSGSACAQTVTLSAGTSTTIAYTVRVATVLPTGTLDVVNVASAPGTSCACTVDNATVASLDTVKTLATVNGAAANPGVPIKSGDVLGYTVTVTNTGGSPSSTTLTEHVPDHTTYSGTGEGWTCGAVTAGSSCTQGLTVAGGSSNSVTYTVTVGALPGGTTIVSNTVATSTGTCTSCTADAATVAHLDTVKTVSAVNGAAADPSTAVGAGDHVQYTITVANSGGSAGSTTITETVPAHTTYTGAGEGWSCAAVSAGSQCTQTVSAPSTGSTPVHFTVTVGTLPDGTTSVANSVTTSNGTCSACSVSDPTVGALSTSKALTSVNGSPVAPGARVGSGDVLGYTITVTNAGGAAADTTLTETVPAHTTYTGTGEGWSCTDVTAGSQCTQTVTVSPSTPSAVAFTATVGTLPNGTAAVSNTVSTSNGACSGCTVSDPTVARLDTVKSVSEVAGQPADASTPVDSGDAVVYTITVTDSGGAAGATTVTETVPAHTTYSGTGEGWTCADVTAGSQCTQTLTAPALATASATFTVTVGTLPVGTTTVANSITTSAGTCSACSVSNHTVGVLDTVKRLSTVDGTAAAGARIGTGDVLGYTITVSNTGGTDAATTLTETVPDDTTYTGTGEGWTCAAVTAGAQCTQDVTAPAAGSSAVTFTVTVATLPDGTHDVANTVTSSNGSCSGCSVSTPTVGALSTVKTLAAVNGAAVTGAATVASGDVLRYAITVTNSGGSSSTTTLTEHVPADTTYTGTGEGWDCTAGATCSRDVTAPAAAATTVDFTVTVGSVPGTLSIDNTVDSSVGSCTSCSVSTATVGALDTVKTLATVDGAAAGANTQVEADDVLGYTLTVTNTGGTGATTTLTETVPAHTTYAGAGEGWNCANASAGSQCTQDVTVAGGASATIGFTVTVDSFAPVATDPVENSVSSSNGSCTACTVDTPWQEADVSVTKTVDHTSMALGGTVHFTVTVTDNGPDTATAVSVIDTPTGMTTTSANASQGTFDAATGIWTVGTLTSGSSATLVTTATVTSRNASNVAAAVNPSQVDPDPSNNSSTVPVHVPTNPAVTPHRPNGSPTTSDPARPTDPPSTATSQHTASHTTDTPDTTGTTSLASTGVPISGLLLVVGLLLVIGTGLTLAARRRRRPAGSHRR